MNDSAFQTIATWIAALAATGTLYWSVYTQSKIQKRDVKRVIIEAFNHLQRKVLDNLDSVVNANTEVIVEEKRYRRSIQSHVKLVEQLKKRHI